ncbi:hypothetical protein N657DRAFT_692045 [Parathielavia appendiculata]|uniref:Uncharacterized protein n=1 Tax=Parathielavia appendiculata TaxID=2587402 RepID=A0AAN6Z2D9_9PEZI|nr:hypothetical protein N657DRAFT_692045 [Parathielavia appendiculata]
MMEAAKGSWDDECEISPYSWSDGDIVWTLPKWTGRGNPSADNQTWKLKVHFDIYALARTLELAEFEHQVKPAIKRGSQGLDVFTIIDIVKQAYPTLIGHDTWFPEWLKLHIERGEEGSDVFSIIDLFRKAYPKPIGQPDAWFLPWIKSRIKDAFVDDPGGVKEEAIGRGFMDDFSVVKLMLECILETYLKVVECLGSVGSQGPAGGPEPEPELEPEPVLKAKIAEQVPGMKEESPALKKTFGPSERNNQGKRW